MTYNIGQPTFAGLEIGDDLQSRYDTAKYATALRRARNVLGRVGGGFYSRPGMTFCAVLRDSTKPGRLVPFQYSLTQSYAMLFEDEELRLIYGGGLVAKPELIITGATNTNPLVVTIPDSGYVVGTDVFFSGVAGMVQINGMILRVLSVVGDAVTFDADATGWGVFTGSTGGVAGGSAGGSGGEPPPPAPGDPLPTYPDEEPDPPIIMCVDAAAYLFSGLRAGRALPGDVLLLLDENGEATHEGLVTANRVSVAARLCLHTLSGITLTVSDTAPIPTLLMDGSIKYVAARRLRGDELVPVQDGDGLRWEPLAQLSHRPPGMVARISAGDGVYAAGDEPGRYIFTHNRKPLDDEEFP